MPRITAELVRKKAEHHDGLLADLEELSLHQCELEGIDVLGTLCRKLQILYLQNNIIPRIENVYHLKELRYLNLALNNITKIEGLSSCEFLRKLDLTVNFIDVDELESSMVHLSSLMHLRELFLMGNPCAEWPGYRAFVAYMLPQLQQLDGKDIVRTDRITAAQAFPGLTAELRSLAAAKRASCGRPADEHLSPSPAGGVDDDDDGTEAWSIQSRVRMVKELAERKDEAEKRRREMEPPVRDYSREQEASVESIRAKERALEGLPRQCNEGRWEFKLEDDDGRGNCVLRLGLSKFMDTSLVDVDVHPRYVSIILKSKLFRLLWPEEVRASDATCQRSATTGELVITAPMLKQRTLRGKASASATAAATGATAISRAAAAARPKLADEMMEEARRAAASRVQSTDAHTLTNAGRAAPAPSVTTADDDDDHPEVPPLE